MNKSYVEDKHVCFTSPTIACYAYVDDAYHNACTGSVIRKMSVYSSMVYTVSVLFS
jgi:hypothetical protein